MLVNKAEGPCCDNSGFIKAAAGQIWPSYSRLLSWSLATKGMEAALCVSGGGGAGMKNVAITEGQVYLGL